MSIPDPSRDPSQRGASLVELIVFIVIVGVALAGVLGVMSLTTARSADAVLHKQALAAAEALLEEISLQNFSKPAGGFTGPFTPANRALFDTVDDYNGFSGIYTIDGVAVAALAGYNLTVSVAPAALGPAGRQVAAGEAKLITVTVTDPTNTSIALSGYRTHYGP
jgi:MSHA pilin protein MshD